MYIEAILIGLIIGIFTRGRLENLSNLNIRGWYMIIFSLILSFSPLVLNNFDINTYILNILMYVALIIILVIILFNLDKKGMPVIFIGGLYNTILMTVYGFKMPVYDLGFENVSNFIMNIKNGSLINYVIINNMTMNEWWKYFSKFIVIPKYPFAIILSIGDILIFIGIIYLIVGEMRRTSYTKRGRMVNYSYVKSNRR